MASNYARRAWARALIDRAGGQSIPRYGSVEWVQLPEAHPVKIAAVVVAAEAWATDADTLPDRLEAEVDTLARAHKRAEDTDYRQRMDAHRAEWQNSPVKPRPQRGDASVPLEEIGRRYRLQVINGGGGAA